MKDILIRIAKFIYNPYKSLGLSWSQLKMLNKNKENNVASVEVLNTKIYFRNGYELKHGLREIFMEEIYSSSLSTHPTIVDCGAHIGLSVIYFYKKNPTAKIIAFEPDGGNFELLAKNCSFIPKGNLDLRNEAVWHENTELSFISRGDMSSKIGEDEGLHITKVKAIKLKDIINEEIDFLKLDIEGAEYLVVKDIESKLPLIKNVFLEYHGSFNNQNELLEIIAIFLKNGFHFYIKEAVNTFDHPFVRVGKKPVYDIQLNIFFFQKK